MGNTVCTESQLSDRLNSTGVGSVDRKQRVRIWTQPGRYHIDSTVGLATRSALNHSYQTAWTTPGVGSVDRELRVRIWTLSRRYHIDSTAGWATRSALNHSYQTVWTAPGWDLWIENWELGYEHSQVDTTLTVQQDGQHGLHWITAIRPPEQHRGGLCG